MYKSFEEKVGGAYTSVKVAPVVPIVVSWEFLYHHNHL